MVKKGCAEYTDNTHSTVQIKIVEYQHKLDHYNPVSIDTNGNDNTTSRTYHTDVHNIRTPMHVQSCSHPSLSKSRITSNGHISYKLIQLYEITSKGVWEAYVAMTKDILPLQTHLLVHLKHT